MSKFLHIDSRVNRLNSLLIILKQSNICRYEYQFFGYLKENKILNNKDSMAVFITKSHLENLSLLNVTLNIVAKIGQVSLFLMHLIKANIDIVSITGRRIGCKINCDVHISCFSFYKVRHYSFRLMNDYKYK